MILYQLCCEDGHDFEAWFHDHGVYGELVKQGRVECPYCGSTKVVQARVVCDIFKPRLAEETSEQPAKISKMETSTGAISAQDDQNARDVARRILNAVGIIHDYAEGHREAEGGHGGDEDANVSEDEDADFFHLSASQRRDH